MLLNSVPIFWCVEQYRKQHNKIMNFTFTLFLISILDLRLSERGHSLLRCFSSIGKICLNWWWPSHLISFFFYFLLFESFVTIIGLTLRLVPCFFMCQHYTTYRILTDRIETAYFITWPHTGFWITRATYISSLNIYCAYVYSLSLFVSLTLWADTKDLLMLCYSPLDRILREKSIKRWWSWYRIWKKIRV